MDINIDLNYGEYLLEELSDMSHKSKVIFLSYLFAEEMDAGHLIAHINSGAGLNYRLCQSPIEEIFAVAYDMRLITAGFPYTEVLGARPQAKIIANDNIYYADFLIEAQLRGCFRCDHEYKLVIECDGHEFHEKTKAQVEKRNKRDIDLKTAGYDVLHFSGSQIFKKPIECADQVFEYITAKVGRVEFINGNL